MGRMVWWIGIVIVAMLGAWLVLKSSGIVQAAVPERAAPSARASTAADVDAFLAPYQAALDASRRPMHRITLAPFPDDVPTVSKLGGRAWWPIDEAPPEDSKGNPLALLAQINFAELPPTPGYPDHGLLQFFVAGNDFYGANFEGALSEAQLTRQRDFRVVYWADLDQPSRVLPVAAADYLPHAPAKPRRMSFHPGQERMSARDHRFEALIEGSTYARAEAHAESLGVHADDFVQAVFDRFDGAGHKIGGYPEFTQTDPRESGEFELLLQLDTDDQMMWGDSGVGGFFIRPADLARADFSRVLYSWDCY